MYLGQDETPGKTPDEGSREISEKDLLTAWDFLKESLKAEQRKSSGKITPRLVELITDRTERVIFWVKILAPLEAPEPGSPESKATITQVDPIKIQLAAILQDCAQLQAQSPNGLVDRIEHMDIGKEKALPFTKVRLGKTSQVAQEVAFMVESHDHTREMARDKKNPTSKEERILHDANFLDYIDWWGLLHTVEFRFRSKTEWGNGGLQGALEYAAKQGAHFAEGNELLTASAIHIAGNTSQEGNAILHRLTRCYKYLKNLNLETLDDFRKGFYNFLWLDNPKPPKTPLDFAHYSPKKKEA